MPDDLADRLAAAEHAAPDAGHARRDFHALKGLAVVEGAAADRRHARADRRVRQRRTQAERAVADVRHARRHDDRRQVGAAEERPVGDILQLAVVSKLERAKALAALERAARELAHAGQRHVLHGPVAKSAHPSGAVADDGKRHPVRLTAEDVAGDRVHVRLNRRVRQAVAVVERAAADVRDAVGNDDASKVLASVECIPLDQLHLRRLAEARHLFKPTAVECIFADDFERVVLEHDVLEIRVVAETVVSKALDAADPDVARTLGVAVVTVLEERVAVTGDDERVEVRRLRREHAEVDHVRLREDDRVRDSRAGMEHVVGEVRDARGDEDVGESVAAAERARADAADRIRHPQRLDPRFPVERGLTHGRHGVVRPFRRHS